MSRVAGLSVRTVPLSQADWGMMLLAVAGLEARDRDDAGIERIDIARGDGLQGDHDLRADDHRVDALMRHRPVAALAFDGDGDFIGRRHDRALAQPERADRKRRHVVHAVDFLDAELVHEPVVDHRHGARAALFGGLKDDDGVAGEVAGLRQALRRAEQHRGMAVMAAGVHLAGGFGPIGEIGLFLDRQRVHVGPQADRARARSLRAANDADHAGAADRSPHLVAAEGAKPVGDELGGGVDVVKELGVLVDFPSPGLSVGNETVDGGGDRHWGVPCKRPTVDGAARRLSTRAITSR